MKTVRAFLFSVMCLAPALPLLGEAPDWENEEVTGINKEAPRASVLPAGDKTLSLNGDWKFKFSMTPDFSDERFAGNLSGVAIRYKLFCLEQKTRLKERWLVSGLRERARVAQGWMNLMGMPPIDAEELEISLKRRLPYQQ